MIRTFVNFRGFLGPYRGRLLAGALLAVAEIALGIAQPWPLKIIVDDVLSPHASGHFLALGLPVQPQVLLALAVGALLVLVGVGAVADYWSTWLMEGAGQRIGNDLREALFAHLQRLSLRYHGQQHVGDLAARLTSDVDRVQDLLVQSLAVLVPNALLVAGMAVVMLLVDPTFAALAFAATPFMAFGIYRTTRDMKSASRRWRRSGGAVAAAATESLGAIQVVQAFGLEGRSQARFRELNRASLAASLDAIRYQARFGPVVDISAAVATGTVLWFGANRVLSGRMTMGVLLVFLAYLASLYRPIKALSRLGYVISRGSACAERIGAILAEEPAIADLPGALPARSIRGQISFHEVVLSYGREPVLQGVNLQVEAGESVAVVGPTGAGKSSLVSLVPRFYDPEQGAVLVDGVDIRRLQLASLRGQVSLVLQDTILFRGTLWENIACGRPEATPSEVARAVKLALVDEFAERLPDGLETLIGERGGNLSGGQRQRVAIARAIVRDAPILILDEPTSALDPLAEMLVMDGMRNLMRARTTLLVAHRLSTVLLADRIVVMDAGRIVEEGRHDQLHAAGGRYRELFGSRTQAVGTPS